LEAAAAIAEAAAERLEPLLEMAGAAALAVAVTVAAAASEEACEMAAAVPADSVDVAVTEAEDTPLPLAEAAM
jgi:hypothetical protein